jgi:hypothetical protein
LKNRLEFLHNNYLENFGLKNSGASGGQQPAARTVKIYFAAASVI